MLPQIIAAFAPSLRYMMLGQALKALELQALRVIQGDSLKYIIISKMSSFLGCCLQSIDISFRCSRHGFNFALIRAVPLDVDYNVFGKIKPAALSYALSFVFSLKSQG